MVYDVKKLAPNLNIDISRARFDVVVLEYREVDVDQAWADHGVSAIIAEQVHACSRDKSAFSIRSGLAHVGERSRRHRVTEAVQLDVISDTAGIDRVSAASRTRNA